MTRPAKSRIRYCIAIIALLALGFSVLRQFEFSPNALVIVVLCLVLPGRFASFFWRDFYAGLELMQRRDYPNARINLERFVHRIRQQRWMKKLIYCKWGIYTWDIEAMALNNLGSTLLQLTDPAGAESHFVAALNLDSGFPLPYANLAIVHFARGNADEAVRYLDRSRVLGYYGLDEEAAKREAQTIRARLGSNA